MTVYLYTFFNLFPLICILQEKDARDIEIPNIRWEVFELMMRFVANSSFLSDLEKKKFPFWRNCIWWAFFIYWLSILYRFIYTGSVDVSLDIAQDLLRAADQYLLEGLKRLCEYTIAQVSNWSWFVSRHVHIHSIYYAFLMAVLWLGNVNIRIYHWRMCQACMSFQKPSMRCHWGTHASCLSWSSLINWVLGQGICSFLLVSVLLFVIFFWPIWSK